MQRKDLALRVLSTAAIMSIVTSIAAPAFADIYYIGNGSIDVETITSTDGKQQYVKVTQGNKTYTDTSDEIVIKDGIDEDSAAQKEDSRIEGKKAKVAVPDKERPATQELEAAGTADAAGPAAGESQPDPDDAFTLSEEEEDSEEGKDPTENPTENPTDNPTEKPRRILRTTPRSPPRRMWCTSTPRQTRSRNSRPPNPPSASLPPLRQRPGRPLWPTPLLRPLRQRAAPKTPAKTLSGSSITGPKGC